MNRIIKQRAFVSIFVILLAAFLQSCSPADAPGPGQSHTVISPSPSTAVTEAPQDKNITPAAPETGQAGTFPYFTEFDSAAELLGPHGISFGTVINSSSVSDREFQELIRRHFNSLTASNEMKAYSLLDQRRSQLSADGMPVMDYTAADRIVKFASDNGILVRGHCLVWDAYMSDWFFREGYIDGAAYAGRDTMLKRLEYYITEVVTHFEEAFPGTVYCWDVVNEAVGDGPGDYEAGDARRLRTLRSGEENMFYKTIGGDYVSLSFLYARNAAEALGADIKLFYNDYNAFIEDKAASIRSLVTEINSSSYDSDGSPRRLCDGVGMQGYIGGYGVQDGCLDARDIGRIENAIKGYAEIGLEVQLTEMAVRNYTASEQYAVRHAQFYRDLFKMLVNINQDGGRPLTGISIWGLCDSSNLDRDSYSYRMNSPYGGLFTADYHAKESFVKVYEYLKACEKVFIKGADVSSIISLEESGVKFYSSGGDEQDIFVTLKQNGINYVRVRIWNDPYDDEGRPYGGGHCDLETALKIAVRAASQDMKLAVDFHYSDFWADPSKQQAPKAWSRMETDEKTLALYAYTKDCLERLTEVCSVGIVQLGNETVGALAGETGWDNICRLMNAGSRAVREISNSDGSGIRVSVHFTNPEQEGRYDYYAELLDRYRVDYDIFASSYYSYWHGTAENLAEVLRGIAEKYGKDVLIAETAYPWTYDNGDSFANTLSSSASGDLLYPVSVQGQAEAIRAAAEAVASAGDRGLGLFYWEPAWLPVPEATRAQQALLWERFGSGWASSFAAEYDPDDAGVWYGGSSWDNQALFDFNGKPLPSLSVFKTLGSSFPGSQ